MIQSKLNTINFISVFIRSFFIQAVWNFKSMISIGLCYAIIPIGKKLYPDKEEYRAFLVRHLSFFNAHPYFVSYALGSIAHLEENESKEDIKSYENLEKFKNAIIGPLGAIGDKIFWATIKPASIIFGFVALVIIPNLYLKLIFIPVFLILYNIPHFYIRYAGIVNGYKEGTGVYKILRNENFTFLKILYMAIGAFALGVFLGFILFSSVQKNMIEIPIFLMSGTIAFFLRSQKRMTYLPVLIPMVVAIVLGLLIK